MKEELTPLNQPELDKAELEQVDEIDLNIDELMEMTESFQAANAPLVLAALWLARHRKRLHS